MAEDPTLEEADNGLSGRKFVEQEGNRERQSVLQFNWQVLPFLEGKGKEIYQSEWVKLCCGNEHPQISVV